jgi:hypothetical protein
MPGLLDECLRSTVFSSSLCEEKYFINVLRLLISVFFLGYSHGMSR